jgi:spore coat protein H
MLKKIISLLIVINGLELAGCDKIVDPEALQSFGVKKVELTIDSEHLGELNANLFARLQVPAQIDLEGKSRDILVRYSGQTSINHTKKSFTVEFLDGDTYLGHRFYVISAQYGDPTGLNPFIGFHAFAQAGLQTPHVEAAALYLNREYRGLYFLIEPIDEDFFRKRGQRLGSFYEATRANAHFSFAGGYDVRLGFENQGETRTYFGDLERIIEALDGSTADELPSRLEPLLDVESYLSYLAVSVLFHNYDGYFNNFRMHRQRPTDRFTFIPWDVDHLLESHPTRSTIWGANELSQKLLAVPAYRQRYRQILLELMDQKLTPESLDELLDETAAKINQAFAADRLLAAPEKSVFDYAAGRKISVREWYAKIRGDLALLD